MDVLARTLGDAVSRQWGQGVVVENRPGAGGLVASQALVGSAPDATRSFWSRAVMPPIRFVSQNSLRHVQGVYADFAGARSSPNILLVRADSPFKTLGDMIAAARAKPGSLSFGHAGTGTSTHLAGELLKNLAHIDLSAISYKGGAPAINDLLGGQFRCRSTTDRNRSPKLRPVPCGHLRSRQ
ncbi:MAG: tripartite tricarboxylate transporter substrate-binding protein [Bradyrhizobium sp.]